MCEIGGFTCLVTQRNAVGKGVNVCALLSKPLLLELAAIFENDDALLRGWGEVGSNVVPFAKRSRRPIKLRAS